MSKGAVNFNENKVEYYTPKELVDKFGHFDYDHFTTKENAERLGIANYDTIETNGFLRDWSQFKRIWINPPFNLKKQVVDKIKQYIGKCDIYLLIPIETLTTKILDPLKPFSIYIPNGRVKYLGADMKNTRAPAFGSVVIHIGDNQVWY